MDDRDNQQAISAVEMGWLVGMFDGGGSMELQKHQTKTSGRYCIRPVISVENCDLSAMVRVREILDKLGVGHNDCVSITTTGKELYRCTIYGMMRCERFLAATKGLFVAKSAHASTVQRFIEKRRAKSKGDPYTEDEVDLGVYMESLNGHKPKVSLRDCMRDAPLRNPGGRVVPKRRMMIQSELTRDGKSTPEMSVPINLSLVEEV